MTVTLSWMQSPTVQSSTFDDRNDATHVTGCPQILLEGKESQQIANLAAAGLNKKERAGSVRLSSSSCISACSPQASSLSLQVFQERRR